MAERLATGLAIVAITTVVIGVAVAWNAASLTSQAVQAIRRRL